MKTTLKISVIFLIFATTMLATSCSTPSSKMERYGITNIITIDTKYSIICFDGKKSSSQKIQFFMQRQKYGVVKITEFNSIIAKLPAGKLHSGVFGKKEYSKNATEILRKINTVMSAENLTGETYCPFFHSKNGKLSAGWEEFISGSSDLGYFLVTKENKKSR